MSLEVAHYMAMERRGPNRFFYSSRRVGGKVKKVYYGGGVVGSTAAYLHKARQENVKGWQDFRRHMRELTHELRAFNNAVLTLFEATLYDAGCYRPRRHRWRLRVDWSPPTVRTGTQHPDLAPSPAELVEQLQELLAMVRRGNFAAMAEISGLLRSLPKVCRSYFDEAGRLEQKWRLLLAAKDPAVVENCCQEAVRNCPWLQGSEANPLLHLLGRRLLVNFLALRFVEFAVADTLDSEPAGFLVKVQRQFQQFADRALLDVTELQRLLPSLERRREKWQADARPIAGTILARSSPLGNSGADRI